MKKLFAMGAVLALVSTASAGDINFYLSPGSCESVGPGNPVIYLAPSSQDAAMGDRGYDEATVNLYMQVNQLGDGCGDEVVGSVGFDLAATATAGSGTLTGDFDFAASANWSGTNNPGAGSTPSLLVSDARAVVVPSSSGDVLWSGFCPGGPYNIGTLALSNTATLNGGNPEVTYELKMAVGVLKIVPVYDPAATQGPATYNVSFGYTADESSPDVTNNGSTPGANAGVADATVIIRKKGDFGSFDANGTFIPGVPDGEVTGGELTAWLAADANGSPDQETVFLGDFGSFDANGTFLPVPDCDITGGELAQFLLAEAVS